MLLLYSTARIIVSPFQNSEEPVAPAWYATFFFVNTVQTADPSVLFTHVFPPSSLQSRISVRSCRLLAVSLIPVLPFRFWACFGIKQSA